MLDPDLHRALLVQLQADWAAHSAALFSGLMRPPVIEIVDQDDILGLWQPDRRTISLPWGLVLDQPWVVVAEVLKHEMAHQFCDEILGASAEAPHGPTFQRVCAQRGIDPRHAGLPTVGPGAAAGDTGESQRVFRRIRRLLALAESPEQHEAEAAMAAARRLLLAHNLELERVRAPRRFAVRQVGPCQARHPAHHKVLAGILAGHFFVSAIWVHAYRPRDGQPARVLELSGTPENLDIAAYAWDFLVRTGERLWAAHKAREGIASDRPRRRFLAGVMVGFLEKLDAEAAASATAGLVWTGDPLLQDWLARRHPDQRTVRPAEMVADASWDSGRRVGREIVLHRGITTETQAAGAPVPRLASPPTEAP